MKKLLFIFLLCGTLIAQTKWSDYPRVTSVDTNDVFLMSRTGSMKSFLFSSMRNTFNLLYGRLGFNNTWTGINNFSGSILGNGNGLSISSNTSIVNINGKLTSYNSRIIQDSTNLVLDVRSIYGGDTYENQDTLWTVIGDLWSAIASGKLGGMRGRIVAAESGIKINTDSVNVFSNKFISTKDSLSIHRAAINVNSSNISLGVTETNKLKDSVTVHRGLINVNKDSVNILSTRTLLANDSLTVHRAAINTNANSITLKVSSTDYNGTTIASKINLTDATVTIDAKHIKIDGTTTFSAGYDPTGKIALGGAATDVNNNVTTISGGKITTKSLTASQIRVNTLSADSITAGHIRAGVLNADSIQAGYLSANRIAAKSLDASKIRVSSLVADSITAGHIKSSILSADSIKTGSLAGINMSIGSANNIFKADANGIYLGNATFASAPFRVNMLGAATMTSGNIGGWTINSTNISSPSDKIILDNTNSQIHVGTAPNILIDGVTNTIGTSDFNSGVRGWQIGGSGNAEFQNAVIRGTLRSGLFLYNEVMSTAGTAGVFPSAAKLRADVVIPSTPTYGTATVSVDVDDREGITHLSARTFAVNDILRLKDGLVGDTWLKVSSYSDQTSFWRYTCIIMAGTNNVTYTKGLGIPDYGVSGQGFIIQTADQANSPYLQMATHAATFSSQDVNGYLVTTPQLKIGNLNGSYGYVSDTYGFATGQYGSGLVNLTIEPTNGFRIRNNTTTLANWDNSGNILIGQTGVGQSNVYITSGAVKLRNNITDMITLNSDGTGNFAGNITSTATITGGTIQTATSGQRVVISGIDNIIKFYDSNGFLGGSIGAYQLGDTYLYITGQSYLYVNSSVRATAFSLYNGDFSIDNYGKITRVNNISPTAKYCLVGDGISFTPRLLAMSDLPALTANRVLLSDASGYVSASTVTNTTLGYLDATSSIQTQLNGKQATITGGASSIVSSNLTASKVAVSDASGKVAVSTIASSELFTPAYGELYDAVATSTITCDGSTYVKWTGSTVGECLNVTGSTATDDLTIATGNGGKYKVSWTVSFKANTTGDYYWTAVIDRGAIPGQVIDSKSKKRINVGTTNVDYNVSGSAIISLSAGAHIDVGCYGTNTNVVTVSYLNLNITKISN